jgi:hypothetical protein
MEWVPIEGLSDRAALRVPVVMEGQSYWFQLDTGADVTILYDTLPKEKGWQKADPDYVVPGVEAGGMALGSVLMMPYPQIEADEVVQGTLGLDVFIGKLAILDYPGQRFCLLSPGSAPPDLWSQTAWSPAVVRDSKLFLAVNLNDEPVEGVFDTGGGPLPLIVDYEPWQRMTGLVDSTEATERLTGGSAWGRDITLLGAPAPGALAVGSVRLEHPMIYFEDTAPFSSWAFPAQGLLGNELFWNRVVLLDLGLLLRLAPVTTNAIRRSA